MLIAHSPESLQHALNVVANTYRAVGLRVNIKKTQIVHQPSSTQTPTPTFFIDNTPLEAVPHFKYLGSILSDSCNVDADIQSRINLASAAFGRLRARVFTNKNLKAATKAAVYQAVCVSTLLYGSEAWTPYRRHIRSLEAFHIRCLRRILGITWEHHMTYTEIYQRTNSSSIEVIMGRRQLRWLGHVIRMPAARLPRQVLYDQLQSGQRSAGGQQKRYKDHMKVLLKNCNIPPTSLERIAVDRDTWRSSCLSGVSHLEEKMSLRHAEKRSQRHERAARTVQPGSTHTCLTCGEVYGSATGLRNHMRKHERTMR